MSLSRTGGLAIDTIGDVRLWTRFCLSLACRLHFLNPMGVEKVSCHTISLYPRQALSLVIGCALEVTSILTPKISNLVETLTT